MAGGNFVLTFERGYAMMSVPFTLLAVLYGWFNFYPAVFLSDSSLESVLTSSLMFLFLLIASVYPLLVFRRYKLSYNDKEIVRKAFLLKDKVIPIDSIKDAYFGGSTNDLYIVPQECKAIRVGWTLKGFNHFAKFLKERINIRNFELYERGK